jgi:hypothetical protein
MSHTGRFSDKERLRYTLLTTRNERIERRKEARKSRLERIKNEHIKEIMGVKEKPDIIDIIEKKRLQWYGHVKRIQ